MNYAWNRNVKYKCEIFPAGTDSRFLREVRSIQDFPKFALFIEFFFNLYILFFIMFMYFMFTCFIMFIYFNIFFRLVYLHSDFHRWTTLPSCCTITTNSCTKMSSYVASTSTRRLFHPWPTHEPDISRQVKSLPYAMKYIQVTIWLYNILLLKS